MVLMSKFEITYSIRGMTSLMPFTELISAVDEKEAKELWEFLHKGENKEFVSATFLYNL